MISDYDEERVKGIVDKLKQEPSQTAFSNVYHPSKDLVITKQGDHFRCLSGLVVRWMFEPTPDARLPNPQNGVQVHADLAHFIPPPPPKGPVKEY